MEVPESPRLRETRSDEEQLRRGAAYLCTAFLPRSVGTATTTRDDLQGIMEVQETPRDEEQLRETLRHGEQLRAAHRMLRADRVAVRRAARRKAGRAAARAAAEDAPGKNQEREGMIREVRPAAVMRSEERDGEEPGKKKRGRPPVLRGAAESEEQRAARLAERRERNRVRRDMEAAQERAARLAMERERSRQRRAAAGAEAEE